MSKRISKKNKPSIQSKSSIILSNSKDLVCVNQEKIRKEYLKKCKRSMKDLEKLKQQILEYETNDLPKYEKWYYSQFRKILSEIQDTHEKAKALFHKIQEIEYYRQLKNLSYYEAYLLVEDKLKNPEKYKEEKEPEHEYFEFSEEEEDFSQEGRNESEDFHFNEDPQVEQELEEAFKKFLHKHPEYAHLAKNPTIYKILYENFRKKFYEDYYFNNPEKIKQKSEYEKDLDQKIKAKYRELARKLHPDYRKESNSYFDELWYEVQAAYRNKDLNRLEMLLALSSIHQGELTANFSVSQILEVQKEFKEQIRALRARIKIIKKNEAWGFSKLESTIPLAKKISKRLQESLADEKENYAYFQHLLKKWSTPPYPPKQRFKITQLDDKDLFFSFLFD